MPLSRLSLDLVSLDAPYVRTYSLAVFRGPKFYASSGQICESPDAMISWSINDLLPHRLVFDLSLRGVVSASLGRSADARS